MKHLICLSVLLAQIFIQVPAARAQAPIAGPVGSMDNAGAKVGVAAGVRGGVELIRSGVAGRVVTSGETVFLGDEISTNDKGSLQILLLDHTTFTIGPNSAITIDEFVYDPQTHAGQITASVAQGTFRFITGKIAKKKPENMKVNLPSGSIGVRGTMVMGRSEGQRTLVVLTGPGDRNNTGDKKGAVVIGNVVDGKIVEVKIVKTGFGTVIEGEGTPPSNPFQVPEEQINEMTEALNPEGESADSDDQSSPSSNGSASEQSGQSNVDTGLQSLSVQNAGEITQTLQTESLTSAQDAADETIATFDGITTFEALRTVSSGVSHFSGTGTLYDGNSNSAGNYDILFDIDFGSRTVGGGDSAVFTSAAPTGFSGKVNFPLEKQSFSNETGFALFSYENVQGTSPSAGFCSANCTATSIDILLFNENGEIAAGGVNVIEIQDTSSTPVTLDGVGTMTREPGLSSGGGGGT